MIPMQQTSLALLTDLYQLTMAYGYWRLGRTSESAAFHLCFRENPFGGGYTVAGGLDYVAAFLRDFQFDESDLEYLANLEGGDGKPLFCRDFLQYLRQLRLGCDIDAVPEGTVVFPHQPLLRVTGPLLECQLLETAVLNMINFQTLIATKASRICAVAREGEVLEFGLRRAQGIDGGLSASRAAYIGGCAATSNVLAGKVFGIPVKGTHAHSWVMSFGDELEAFSSYAEVMPNNCVFLVDTYDSLQGVRNAITIGKKLRIGGQKLHGIRLDSGDLAYLSHQARRMLDDAGLNDTKIIASNDLDEHLIRSLNEQGAAITVWGVGTRLATAYDQPALGGVYKLSALKPGADWQHKVKVSEQTVKVSTPGILQVRRFSDDRGFAADMTYDQLLGDNLANMIVHPLDHTRRKMIEPNWTYEDLLVPVMRAGDVVLDSPPLDHMRKRTMDQLSKLHAGVRRFDNPHQYPAGLERNLHDLKTRMILEAREPGS